MYPSIGVGYWFALDSCEWGKENTNIKTKGLKLNTHDHLQAANSENAEFYAILRNLIYFLLYNFE